jgi:aminopeptidase N
MRILIVLLLLAVPAAAAEIDVTSYDIEEQVETESVTAKVRLTATTDRVPKEWVLDLSPRMRLGKLTVNGVAVPAKREGNPLEASVEGSPKGGGGGRKSTLISSTHARIRSQYAWYPRVPDDGASYRTAIDARKDWSVRTAGVEKAVEAKGDRRVWTYEQKMPVRAIGLVAGPYTVTKFDTGGGLVFDAWTLPGDEAKAEGILAIAKDAFDRYRKWFGDVLVTRMSILEMPSEYGTMSGYGEAGYILLGKGAFDRGSGDAATVELVVHEVAHAWWAQEVGFANFAHESLASWATLRYLAETGAAKREAAVREHAVRVVAELAASGKDVALPDIRAYGRGLHPAVYRALAYEKGMLILAMVEDAIGARKTDRILASFLEENRGTVVTWTELRAALAKGGGAVKTIRTQWEGTGIPKLEVTHTAKGAGRNWKVSGKVIQSGTVKPFRMKVTVVAVCGAKRIQKTVELKRAETKFSLSTPAKPDAIILDPEGRLLVDAPRSVFDPLKAFERAYRVVKSPNNRDPAQCREAIRLLRRVIDEGPQRLAVESQAGIGRCLFRLAKDEEASKALRMAIAMGASAWHLGWIHLRLGNIADAAGERAKALAHYELVTALGSGASKGARQRAEHYIKTPFRR